MVLMAIVSNVSDSSSSWDIWHRLNGKTLSRLVAGALRSGICQSLSVCVFLPCGLLLSEGLLRLKLDTGLYVVVPELVVRLLGGVLSPDIL